MLFKIHNSTAENNMIDLPTKVTSQKSNLFLHD